MITEFKIFEKNSFPYSLIPIKEFLCDFIIDKFDWWLNRKGPANYKDEFTLWMDDVNPDIKKNEDFPLDILNLTLLIVRNKNGSNIVPATVENFVSSRNRDYPYNSFLYRGKIHLGIELKIVTGYDVIHVEMLKEQIETAVSHELTHAYQYYKRSKKGLDLKLNYINPIFNNTLMDMAKYFPKCYTLENLLFAYYPYMSKSESDARISEFTAKRIKNKSDVVTTQKDDLKIINTNFEDLYFDIVGEFDSYYPHIDDLDIIPKRFINELKECYKHFRLPFPKWAYKYDRDFKGFLKLIYDDLQKKHKKYSKKANKVFYMSKINDNLELNEGIG